MIFKKIMSIALTTAIVLGCGATLNAASSGYKIDDTFPDPALKKYVRQFDLNSDGYLDSSEISKAGKEEYSNGELFIHDPDVRCLDGLEIFDSCLILHISFCNVKKLDMTCMHFKVVMVQDFPNLTTFVCGSNQETLYIEDCPNLKKAYFNLAFNLKEIFIWGCTSLSGSLYLDNCSYLTEFDAYHSDISEVYLHPKAEVTRFLVYNCPLEYLSIRGARLNTLKRFVIRTFGKSKTSISSSGDLYYFLLNHRRPKGMGYEYNSQSRNDDELVINIDWSKGTPRLW